MAKSIGGSAAKLMLISAAALAASSASAAETIRYGYDAHGRLVRVERTGTAHPSTGAGQPIVTRYDYDKADNRRVKAITGSAT